MKKVFQSLLNKTQLLKFGFGLSSLFLIGFMWGYVLPQIKNYIRVEIAKVSEQDAYIRVLPTDVHIHLIPLSITLEKIMIAPKKVKLDNNPNSPESKLELTDILKPFSIEEVSIYLNFFHLLRGDLELRKIYLRGSKIELNIPKQNSNDDIKLAGAFDILEKIPLQLIETDDIQISTHFLEQDIHINLKPIHIFLEKYRRELGVQIKIPEINAFDPNSKSEIRFGIDLKAFLAPEKILLSYFKISKDQASFNIKARAVGQVESLIFNDYDLEAQGHLNLDHLSKWAQKAIPQSKKWPQLNGKIELDMSLKKRLRHNEELNLKIDAQNIGVDQFKFGDIKSNFALDNKIITSKEIQIENPAYKLSLQDLKLNINDDYSIETLAHIDQLNIYELFPLLGLNPIPLWLQVQAEFPCKARFKPEFNINCSGNLEAQNLLLKPDSNSKSTIIAVDKMSAKGDFNVNTKNINYRGQAQLPHSQGSSDGVIDFDKGFKINYAATKLDLGDIKNLSDLKIEGQFSDLSGETTGDSHQATMSLNLKGQNLWLEDFFLGQSAESQISYKKSHLRFDGIKANYAHSNYIADVDLDIQNKQISVIGQSPRLDADDLAKVMIRKVKLPFDVTGLGSVTAKVWGPLELNHLSYDIKSQLKRGSIWREAFDQIFFDVHSRDGEVATDRAQMNRGSALITAQGKAHPNAQIEVKIHGDNIRLDDSVNFQNLNLNLSSHANFDMTLTDYILKPNADLFGHLNKTSISEQAVDDSQFHIRFRENTLEGQGQFFGSKLASEFIIPLNPQSAFLLKLTAQDLNFAPLLLNFKFSGPKKEFESKLTGKLDLSSNSGGFWNSSGFVDINQFQLTRGALNVYAPQDIKLNFDKGFVKVDQFSLVGPNTSLKVTNSDQSSYFKNIFSNKGPNVNSLNRYQTPNGQVEKLDWRMDGKMDMNLIALLLPVFEDLRGELSFACNLKANENHVDFLGSAYIDHGYLKLFDFAHPLSEIKADLLFNRKRVLLNSVQSDFAGGRATGEGQLEFVGARNFPFQLNAHIEKVHLNVPEGFASKGSGDMVLSGHWLPFSLKGQYDITGGLITKEFGGDSDANSPKNTQYLPKNISEEYQSPLNLDLNIDFNKGLPIKNSQIEGSLKGSLNIKGTPQKPSLIGTVTTGPDSKAKFNEKLFEVIAANFIFDDPNLINPKLYLNARTHLDASSRGTEYDVNLLLQGTAQKPVVTLTSQPALSQSDIISLLALGATSSNLSNNISSGQQSSNTSFVLGSAVLQKNPIGKELKDRFDVDLQFTSGIIDETNNLAVQKISLSGKLNDKVGWVYNRAVGARSDNEAKLKYRLGEHLSLVGDYINRAADETDPSLQKIYNPNTLGLDLEFRFQFK